MFSKKKERAQEQTEVCSLCLRLCAVAARDKRINLDLQQIKERYTESGVSQVMSVLFLRAGERGMQVKDDVKHQES